MPEFFSGLSHLFDLLFAHDFEEFCQEEPLEQGNCHDASKEDNVAGLVLDLGADHGRNEDRQRLEELVDAEWGGLRYELKTKQAVDKAVNASILHSPSHRQDDAKVECEVV